MTDGPVRIMSRRPARGMIALVLSLPMIMVDAPRANAAAGCTPRVIDMGTLGGQNSEIDGANSLGDWVGSAQDSHGENRAVLWHDGVIRDLGESEAWAADITDAGVVVGNSDVNGAFDWSHGVARPLPLPAWATGSYVRRINQHDDAVGAVGSADGSSFPIEWRRLTRPRLLPVPAGFDGGEALGINDAGDIVGDVSSADGVVAWEWDHDGTSRPLPPEYPNGFSEANVVNDRGWAAGGLDFGGQIGLWAAVWRKGGVEKLGQLGADQNFSFVFGEDQQGDYVGGGTYTIDDPSFHVFVTHVGMGRLLTMLPLSGDQADRSNAHAVVPSYDGQSGIAVGGDSTTASGEDHATVWTCAYQQAFVPDPGVTSPSTAAGPTRQIPRGRSAAAQIRDPPTVNAVTWPERDVS